MGESNFLVETRLLVICTNVALSLKMLTTSNLAGCQHFGLGKTMWFPWGSQTFWLKPAL